MSVKSPGWGKLTHLMTDHVFSYKDRNKFFAVMYRKGQPDEIGRDGRTSATKF